MRRGFIRRAAGRGRSARTARSGSGSVYRDSSGHQYRVVQVDESDTSEFADPPRKWPRVGLMATTWALILALGTWIAPAFAASGNDGQTDHRDEAATSAKQATNRYLRYGSDLDLDRSEAVLCDGASPEVSPADLDAFRQSYDAEKGGITRIDIVTGDPVDGIEGITVTGTVSYVSDAMSSYEEFVVTVQEEDGVYCVSNAEHVPAEEPTTSDGTGEAVDMEELAADFMRAIVVDRNPEAGIGMQCDDYSGLSPADVDTAITDWADSGVEPTAFLNGIKQAESTETSVSIYEVGVSLDGDLKKESFSFDVGVQGDCIISLAGGDGLI